MATKATYCVKFRRRRTGKTNYKKRLAMAKSGQARLSVRVSNREVKVQVIEIQRAGDRTIAEFNSGKLKTFGWIESKNLPSAYLTGLACGCIAVSKKADIAVFDLGFRAPVHGSVPFAALKGAVDAGMKIKHDEKALPSEERLKGNHIENYANSLDSEAFNKIFSSYVKKGFDVKNISKKFEEVKEKIIKNKW